jgi:hypothetical protein
MTESQIISYLRENGYPEHIVRGGREGLVRRWRAFVDEVERGYEFGLEDYRNDLDLRGIIRLVGAEDAVADADARFASMLTGIEHRVWESAEGDPWWDFGYPRNVGKTLRQDLLSAKLWQE